MSEERRLAARFAEVSSGLLSESTEDLTFDAVVGRAVGLVPGCDASSITLRRRRNQVETIASTEPAVDEVDAAQYTFREGPCLDAAFEHGKVFSPDLVDETRWPRWTARAREIGLGGTIAIRLHTDTETLGALNLYSRSRNGFDDESLDIALIFAAHATDAMSKARLVTGLRAALESRHAIGIAQGVLAVKYAISYERAFEVLHRFSNDTNTKLRDVAAMVVETQGLPTDVEPDEVGTGRA